MNIFLIFSLLFLSLSDGSLTPVRTNKRNFEENEISISEYLVEVIRPSFAKRPKLDPNAKVEIFKLPGEILAYIGTFLENPFETLSPVSLNFRMAMKCFTPSYLLKIRTSFENSDQIPISPELARLLKLDPVYLNSKLNLLFFPGSIFAPECPVTVAYAVNVIKTGLILETDKLRASFKIVEILISKKQYESILVVLRSVSGLRIPFILPEFFTDFLVYIFKSKKDFDFHFLKNSCSDKLPFFFTLPSLPVSLETLTDLIKDEPIDNETFLSSFIASCAIILPISLTEEEETLIKVRNSSLISSIENVPKILIQFALLCNDLRYSTVYHPDISISNEFLTNLSESVASEYVDHKEKIKLYYETLVGISLMRGYKNIFKIIVKSRRVTMNLKGFIHLLLKSTEFLSLVSPSLFKQRFGIKNQVLLLETGKIDREEASKIKNIYERIRVMSCFMELEDFSREVQLLYETFEFPISNLIKSVIERSDEKIVVKTVHWILQSFMGKKFTQSEVVKLSFPLGNPKYLKSILNPKNEEFLILPSDQLYVHVDSENFKEILKLSQLLNQENAKNLRERFVVNWIGVFLFSRIFPHEIEKFFDIFSIKIGNFNYSNEYALSTLPDFIFKDSRVLFKEPEMLGQFVDLLLIAVSERILTEDENFNYWHKLDETNPFLLKVYGIYKLWSDKNLKSFLLNAKRKFLINFNSKISQDFINEIVFEDDVNVQLVSRTFNYAIPATQQVEIKIKNVKELRIFFHENVPKIVRILRTKKNYKIVIDWISIIESSLNFIDYEIILSVISNNELIELFEMEINFLSLHEFFNYSRNTYFGRHFAETNRYLVK